MSDRWAALDSFVRPARATAELWRLGVGLALIVAVGLALNVALSTVLSAVAPEFWFTEVARAPIPGTTPGALLLLLGTFSFFAIGAVLAVQLLHGRSAVTLIGPPRMAWAQFRDVLLLLCLLGLALLVLPPWDSGLALERNMAFGKWVALLPLSFAALMIQVATEEILFRGYLQQQLAARFRSPWVWICVPSVVFAAGHYVPSEAGENALLIALWAAVFGVLMADLTARAGTLGPAIAVHLANNFTALLLISVTDSMSGLALFISPVATVDPAVVRSWLPVDFASMVVCWLVARLALRR